MGLNRSENLRGQLERLRFSQSMDSEEFGREESIWCQDLQG